MSAEAACHVVIHGRVQGVGYRAFVEDEAVRLGLQGWVRNRRAGSVEALFAGTDEAVDAMIEICRKGPQGARVDGIERRTASADELALRQNRHGFTVLPTL
jgi:acylphosphatase